jgi:hypothetical protein
MKWHRRTTKNDARVHSVVRALAVGHREVRSAGEVANYSDSASRAEKSVSSKSLKSRKLNRASLRGAPASQDC